MAKRFGRNQRRKMQHELGKAQDLLEVNRKWLARSNNEKNSLKAKQRDWAKQIINLLGEESAFGKELTQIVYSDDILRGHIRHAVPRRFTIADLMDMSAPEVTRAATDIVNLFCFRMHDHYDILRNRLVLELSTPEGQVSAFAVDEMTMRNMRQDKRFTDYLARNIARRLADHLYGGVNHTC